MLQFRGIRFAMAERFLPPQPVEPWHDVYDATAFGPILPQNPSGLESMLGKSDATPMAENALFLNVFTPAADDRARPVMVWIHGGAFTAGAGSIPWYSGTNLASRGDVVVVTVNYRLGALGFLHVGKVLGAEFGGSGNSGILDQVAAINWVRDNIASFGGDPENITLFGESAGGMSIATLLGVPGVGRLIRNAIPQSGAADAVKDAGAAEHVTSALLASLGIGAPSAGGATRGRHGTAARRARGGNGRAGARWRVALAVLPGRRRRRATEASARGRPRRRCRGRASLGWNHQRRIPVVQPHGASTGAHARRASRRSRLAGRRQRTSRRRDRGVPRRGQASVDDIWSDFATDWIFRIPATRLAEAQSTNQPDTYAYLFTYKSTAFDGALGACHAIDVPFAFDNLDRRGVDMLLGHLTDDTHALATAISRGWLAMARTGSPQHDGLPEWPRYSDGQRAVMELGVDRSVLDDPGSAERQLWASLLD